jgi:hypothetical protein
MPKKILYESFVYRILAEFSEISSNLAKQEKRKWIEFVDGLEFVNNGKTVGIITPNETFEVPIKGPIFYQRGDIPQDHKKEQLGKFESQKDEIKDNNKAFFNDLAKNIALANNFQIRELPSKRLADLMLKKIFMINGQKMKTLKILMLSKLTKPALHQKFALSPNNLEKFKESLSLI